MTQKDTVLKHLKRYTTITPLEAFHVYGIYRLAAVIEQLRKAGLDITTKMKTAPNGSRYAEYRPEACLQGGGPPAGAQRPAGYEHPQRGH